jgi:hypothetical protein
MIAAIFPEVYDAVGKKVLRPFDRRRGPHPTFPMGRYVSQPLTVKCANIAELRDFLLGCKVISDEEQFDKPDYWQPPEDFEETKQGDCDCFALWTWRQLLGMGYDARVVFGRCGRYGIGHAWVEYFADDSCFLVEPQARRLGEVLPRLNTVDYQPLFSVAWDGDKLSYYQHAKDQATLGFFKTVTLIPEWISIRGTFWIRNAHEVPGALWRICLKALRAFHMPRRRR